MRVVLIQAGGIGVRIGTEIPKQFIEVNGKPIIVYTLEKFQNNTLVDEIYIACLDIWCEKLMTICKEYGISKLKSISKGGNSIFQSTRKCLMKMEYNDDTLVLIHEAVRPLITDEMITDSFAVAEKNGNAVACFKSVDETGTLQSDKILTVNTERNLFTIQNPHTFRLGKLREAYCYDDNESIGCQGTAILMYKLGETLYSSKGHCNCFKITYEEDIQHFKALLSK